MILLPQLPQCWDYKHMTPFKNGLKRPMLEFRLQCATVLQNSFIPLIHFPSGEIQKELSLLCKGCGDQTTMKWGEKALTAVSGMRQTLSKAEFLSLANHRLSPEVQGKYTLARTWGLQTCPQMSAQVGGLVHCSLKSVQKALGACCSH